MPVPPPNLPFDKNKHKGAGDASVITKMRKVSAEVGDYQSKVGFTNYTLGSSSKAGFIWSIHQRGLLNDFTFISSGSTPYISESTSIVSFLVSSSAMTLVWTGDPNKPATIKFFVSTSSDGSDPSEINSFSDQTPGTFIWNVNSPPSLGLYYFSSVTTVSDNVTVNSSNVQYFDIVTPSASGYDIIVIAGQSNGQGWNGNSPASAVNANVYQLSADTTGNPTQVTGSVVTQSGTTLYTSNGTATTSGAVATLQSNGYLARPAGKCFAINFANQYQLNGYLRTGRRILLVQTCIAAVSFTAYGSPGTDNNGNGWWNGSSTPLGLGTQNLIYKVSEALKKTYGSPSSNAYDNRLVALCWADGEAEAQINAANINSYKSNLRNFYNSCITGITTNLGTANPTTFTGERITRMLETRTLLVSGMTPSTMAGLAGYAGGPTVTTQAKDVAGTAIGAAIPRSRYVSSELSDGITTGDVHFNGSDLDILSTNYMTAYSQLGTSSTAGKVNITTFFINGSNFTVRWNTTVSSSVVIRLFNNGANNTNTGGTQVGSNISVNAGTLQYTSSGLTLVANNFYYVTITSSLSNVISATSAAFPVPTLQIDVTAGSVIRDISPTNRAFRALGSPGFSTRNGFISSGRNVFAQVSNDNYYGISGSFLPGSYTKTAWVNFSSLSGYPHILSGSLNGAGSGFLHLFWSFDDTKLRAGNTSSNTFSNSATTAAEMPTAKWLFVATVYDSTIGSFGRQTLYVYGENESTPAVSSFDYTTSDGTNPGITPSDSTPANYSLFIGGYKNNESPFRGRLDDVRLYNRVLTAQQIESIRTSV